MPQFGKAKALDWAGKRITEVARSPRYIYTCIYCPVSPHWGSNIMAIPIESHGYSLPSDRQAFRFSEGRTDVPVLLGEVIEHILRSLAEPREESETVEPLASVAG
jgi:hypothetical protein